MKINFNAILKEDWQDTKGYFFKNDGGDLYCLVQETHPNIFQRLDLLQDSKHLNQIMRQEDLDFAMKGKYEHFKHLIKSKAIVSNGLIYGSVFKIKVQDGACLFSYFNQSEIKTILTSDFHTNSFTDFNVDLQPKIIVLNRYDDIKPIGD